MRVGSITFCHPLKWALKNHIFANFEKTEKLWKSSEDCGKLANFVRHLSTRVAEDGGFHLYLSELAFINQFYSIMTRLVRLSLAND